MYFEGFVEGYLIHTEQWYDETIYFNVRYFKPGQSIHDEPIFDKSVLIIDNEQGRNIVQNYKHSLVRYITNLNTNGKLIVLDFDNTEVPR